MKYYFISYRILNDEYGWGVSNTHPFIVAEKQGLILLNYFEITKDEFEMGSNLKVKKNIQKDVVSGGIDKPKKKK